MKTTQIKNQPVFAALFALLALMCFSIQAQAASVTATASGNWSATATWGAAAPGSADTATINAGIVVALDASKTVTTLNINGTLTNNPAASTITVSGTLTMGAYAEMYLGAAPTVGTWAATGNDNTINLNYNAASAAAATYGNLMIDDVGTAAGNSSLASVTTANEIYFGASAIFSTGPSSALTLNRALISDSTTVSTPTWPATTMGGNIYVGGGSSALLTLAGVFSDGGNGYSFTKIGSSQIDLDPATPETYTGNTAINGTGTLTLDYANATTPANGIIKGTSSSPLVFGSDSANESGGNLTLKGKSGMTGSQTFGGVKFQGGANTVSNFINTATSSTLALGGLSRSSFGGTVDFGSSGTTSTGPITTSTGNNSASILGGWATYKGVDWAANDGSGNIIALPTYTTTIPTTGGGSTINYSGAGVSVGSGGLTANSYKLTSGTLAVAGNTLTLGNGTGGLLVTATATATQSGSGSITAGSGNELILNVFSGVTFTAKANTIGGSGTCGVTKTGLGGWNIDNSGSPGPAFTGPLIVRQGSVTGNVNSLGTSYLEIDQGAKFTFSGTGPTLGNSTTAYLVGSGTYTGNSLALGAHLIVQPGGSNAFGGLHLGAGSGGPTIASGCTFQFDLSDQPYDTNLNDMFYSDNGSSSPTFSSPLAISIYPVFGTLNVGSYSLMSAADNSGLGTPPGTINVTFPNGGDPGSANRNISFTGSNKKMLLNVTSVASMPTISGVTGPTVGTSGGTGNISYTANSGTATFYAVSWGTAATAAGFSAVGSTSKSFTAGSGTISITVPAAAAGTYSGYLITSVGAVGGNPSSSTPFTVTVSACSAATAATPTASPSGGVCAGTSVTFTETPSAGLAPYNYQWYTNGTLVTGATSSTFTYAPVNGDVITATAASTCNGTVSAQSSGLTETVFTAPSAATATASPSGTVCSGTSVTFTSVPSGGSGTYSSYAWFTNSTLVTGQTASTLTYVPINGDVVTYTVTDSHGCQSSVSSGLTETVTTTPNQPTALSPTAGNGSVTLNWSAPSGVSPTAYNIYRGSASGGETLYASPSGTGTSYTDSSANNGTLYYYKVTALNGSCESAFSGAPETFATPNPTYVAYQITDSTSGAMTAGGSDTLTISAVDGSGALVSGVSGNIILTFSGLSAAPGGNVATIGGVNQGSPTTLNFVGGQATAVTLVAYGASGSAQTLSVQDAGSAHTSASPGTALSLTVSPAAENKLGFPTKPTSTGNAGVVFATQPIISILDAYGNVENSTDTVGVTANLGNVSPSANTNVAAVAGTVTFSGLYLTNTGSTTLTFTDTTTALTTTNATITMSAGAAAQLAIKTQPSTSVAAGTALATQPAIFVLDAYNNLTTSNATVTVTGNTGNPTPGSATAVSGTATFSGLNLTNAATITLTFASTGMTSVSANPITVTAGTVAGVAWTTQPAGAVYGSAFTTQPVLKTVDQYGNPTTTGLAASLPVIVSGSVALVSGATTSYDIGTSHGNGVVTGVGLGFAAGTGTSPTLTGTVAGYGTTPPVSGYTIWLDASKSTSVAQNNASVTAWNDISGNGNNFTTALGSGTINSSTRTLNGHDVVTFPGGKGLGITHNAAASPNLSVFTVVKPTSGGGFNRAISSTCGAQDYQNVCCFEMDINNAAAAQAAFQRNSAFDDYATGVTMGTPYIWFGAQNGAVNEYLDVDTGSGPIFAVPGQTHAVGTSANYAYSQMSVGCGLSGINGEQNGWNGDIAEVIIYEGTYLSTSQQSQMYTYLENKWLNNIWPYNTTSGASGVAATSSGVLVSPATVTITGGLTVQTRIADSTTTATLNSNLVTLAGIYSGDVGSVTLVTNGYVANFASTNAGIQSVTVSGLNLGGTTATNGYILTQPTLSGTLSPIPTYSAFTITDSGSGSAQAGVADNLTITAVDNTGTTASTFNGPVAITFSGLGTGTDGSSATINGSSVSGAITITFTNGVSVVPLVAHAVQSSVTLSAADGAGNSTGNTGGAPLSLNVSVGPDNAYRISAVTGSPVVGASDSLTISVVDQYQNLDTAYGSTPNITFGGLSTSPNGTAPTVNGTAFGTATAITFSGGTASVPLVATKVESSKTITAVNGGITAAATGGTAPVLSPVATSTASSLAMTTQPSSTAAAGVAFAQQPSVTVLDAYGNPSTAGLTITANAGSFNLNTTGSLTATANGTTGVALFSGLYLTNSGSIPLNFTASGVTSTNSAAITVGGGSIVQLGWSTQPTSGTYGAPFGQPVLQTEDQYGNFSTNGLSSTMTVTVAANSGVTLLGTTTQNIGGGSATPGVITYTDLQANKAVTGVHLTATAAPGYGTPPAGMAIWLDANNPASVVSSGGNVSAWNDASGNGNNFSTVQGTGNPTYANSSMTGETARKVVTFNNNELVNSTLHYTGTALSTFIEFRRISATAYMNMHGTWNGSANDYQSTASYCMDLGPTFNTARMVRNEGGGGLNGGDDTVGVANDYSTNYFTCSMLQGLSGDTVNTIWVNGTGSANGGSVGNFNILATSIGAGFTGGGGIRGAGNNEIAEMLVYTNDQSANRTAIETYLQNKWQGGTAYPNYATAPTPATSAAFNITQAASSSLVTSSENPSGYGDSVTFTCTLSGVTTPTGAVQFKTNGVNFGSTVTANGSGVAVSAATTLLPRGVNTVTAEYAGDNNFLGITNNLSGGQTVTNHPPTVTPVSATQITGGSLKISYTTLIAGGSDVDGDPLTITSIDAITADSVTITTNSTMVYIPATANGDTFHYALSDGNGGAVTNTVTISVVAGTGQQTGSLSVDGSGNVALTFYGVPGSQYNIQGTPSLTMPITWTNIPGSPFTAYTNGLINATDTPAGSSEYYQLSTP